MATKQINQYPAAITVDGAADYLLIDVGGTGTYNKINRNVLLGITSTPIGASDMQTLQNKTLDNTNTITVKDGSFTVQNTSDTTKRFVFSAAGITTATTRTITIPNRTDTLVTLAGTEALTNKTLTSPVITGGTIDNSAITVDSISGHTVATVVTVGGVQMSNGVVNTANAVTAVSIAAGGVQPQALASGTGTGWALSSWTPSWTNLSVGNGVVVAKYIQIGKLVTLYIYITWGTTTSASGLIGFSLPVNYNASYTNAITGVGFAPVGTANMNRSGVANYTGLLGLSTGNVGQFIGVNASATYATSAASSNTTPGAWSTNDVLFASGTYEVA